MLSTLAHELSKIDFGALLGGLGIGAILSQLVSYLLTGRRDRANRETDFRTQQLQELYGPLLSLHKEILAHSELRVKLQQALDQSHVEAMFTAGPNGVEDASDPFVGAILTNIRDENETFRQFLMPRYHEMVNVFRSKIWLAEPATRDHFAKLVEFVFVWDKLLDERLPSAVAPAIGHTEQNLKPFYAHLEEMTDKLRRKIGARTFLH